METIREARTIVQISEDKLRHQKARRYLLRKRFLIDRAMEKAEKNTPSSDSYYIMCDIENFIKEMEAIIKNRRSEVDPHQKKKQSNVNRKANLMIRTVTNCRKRKRPDSVTSQRMRRRRNLGM